MSWPASATGRCCSTSIRRRGTWPHGWGLDFALTDAVAGAFDLVVHASGAPAGLVRALELLDFEGRVLELSWFGDRPVTLPLGEAFHAKRLTIRSSQVGHVAPALRGRLDHRGRLARALGLLDDPRLDALIATELALDDLPGFFATLLEGGGLYSRRVSTIADTNNELAGGPRVQRYRS